MYAWMVRRVLSLTVVLVLLTAIVYGLLEAAPGDFLDMMITANPQLTQADILRLREIYGMDRPVYVRYLAWLGGLLQGDLGYSRVYGLPVLDLLKMRLGNTLLLTGLALTLALVLAVPLGVWAALNRGSWIDHTIGTVAFAGLATPAFWFGIMLILLFGVKLGWLPSGGTGPLFGSPSFLRKLPYLIMPSFVLGLISMASWVRYVRSSMLEVLQADFIRTARAKGLRERTVIYKHGLKNCLLPLITLVGLAFPGLMGGAVVTESVFAYAGVGRLLYESVMGSDYPVAMGALLVLAAAVALFTAASDLIYAVVDPRVSLK